MVCQSTAAQGGADQTAAQASTCLAQVGACQSCMRLTAGQNCPSCTSWCLPEAIHAQVLLLARMVRQSTAAQLVQARQLRNLVPARTVHALMLAITGRTAQAYACQS
jgi:hypothetical protein